MIPPNNFWWLSRSRRPSPPTTCLHFPSKFEWFPLWILPKFSAIPPPPFGFSVTIDPQGINNDRSLICFAVPCNTLIWPIMCKELIRGRPFDFWVGGASIGDLRKKYPEVWFWAQKSLARKYLPCNRFVRQGKTFYYQRFEEKKSLRKKSPIPWSKSNGRLLITCRKSCYCLILRLRHQSLIVHYSWSKLVHVYSLLHDECNTAGRLGTF